MIRWRAGLLAIAVAVHATPATADDGPLSLRTSFRIGTAGALCTAQSRSVGPNLVGMFDREYWIVCQGAAAPIGRLYALRKGKDDPVARVEKTRDPRLTCAAPVPVRLGELAAVQQRACVDPARAPDYRMYVFARGNVIYIADGRRDHDDALRLGLRTIVADAPVEGEVKLAGGEAGDLASFFRSQAEALDDEGARAEALQRASDGCFTEAEAYYNNLAARGAGASAGTDRLIDQAMVESSQGDFEAAEALFDRISASGGGVDSRMGQWLQNQRARHYLRYDASDKAIELLSTPFAERPSLRSAETRPMGIEISEVVARDLNRDGQTLTDQAAILDSERLYLLGVAHRTREDFPAARASYAQAEKRLAAMRENGLEGDPGEYGTNGRQFTRSGRDRQILGMRRALRANIQNELALIAEAEGNFDAAGKFYLGVIDVIDEDFPNSAKSIAVKLRYADLLARQGKAEAASKLRGEVRAAAEKLPCADPRLKGYFGFLAVEPVAGRGPLAPGALPLPGTGKATPPVTIRNDNKD